MEHEKLNFAPKDGSNFFGAIFMSNRITKHECLRRNLFGLPQSKAKFLKQIKAGMILFLFEHEERKLYGVFEATSDGALNIIPNAFRSTGQSFPAQILFKRIWVCKPLCEDEFRSAIQENYYSPNKFHFGLSYEQVTDLIHLFYSRKCDLTQDQNSATDKVRLTEVGSYGKCESDEYGREDKLEIGRRYALPQSSVDALMHQKGHAARMQPHTITDTGPGSYRVNLHTVGAQLPYPQDSYPKTINPHYLPIQKQPTTTSEMDYYKPLPDMWVPYNPDVPEFNLPCNNMIPRTVDLHEANVFKSLPSVHDDCPRTTVLQRPQPNQLFEFPDYIPLPEERQQNIVQRENQNSRMGNYEYVSSTGLSSCIPSTCKKNSKAFNSIVDNTDDNGPNPYQRTETDDYPVVTVDGRLHSDTDLNRASVFSRLSRDQNVYDYETPDSSTGLSLEHVISTLAERKERWSIRKVSEELPEWGSNKQYSHHNKFTKMAVQTAERSNNNQYRGIIETENAGCSTPFEYEHGEDVAEECFELPFYNFKRRNTSQKCKVQGDLSTCSDIKGDEATFVKSKRRRILRPALHQEKQNANGEAEMKISAQMKEEVKEEMEEDMKEQTTVKMPAQTILEYEYDNQVTSGDVAADTNVTCVQAHRKCDPEGEPVEVKHGPSIDADDYIPVILEGEFVEVKHGPPIDSGDYIAVDPEGESVEVKHGPSIDSGDYIPVDPKGESVEVKNGPSIGASEDPEGESVELKNGPSIDVWEDYIPIG